MWGGVRGGISGGSVFLEEFGPYKRNYGQSWVNSIVVGTPSAILCFRVLYCRLPSSRKGSLVPIENGFPSCCSPSSAQQRCLGSAQ